MKQGKNRANEPTGPGSRVENTTNEPTVEGQRNEDGGRENATNEPTGLWIEARKCDKRTQLPRTRRAERNSTKRTESRELLVRSRML
jgi:hypothetical protein